MTKQTEQIKQDVYRIVQLIEAALVGIPKDMRNVIINTAVDYYLMGASKGGLVLAQIVAEDNTGHVEPVIVKFIKELTALSAEPFEYKSEIEDKPAINVKNN